MTHYRFKHFLRERNQYSTTGEGTLLSVSEYYGVKPRTEAFKGDEFESRAASLEGYRIVEAGDLVMNYMLAWKGAYGLSNYAGITSPAYAVFDVDTSMVDRRFLHHRMRSRDMQVEFRLRSKGIIESRLRLYPDALLAMRVVLPDLHVQKKIAAFLDAKTVLIDALIERNEQLINLLTVKRDAYLREHFTPSQSDGCRLRFVTTYQKGRITAGSAKDEGDIPLLTADYVRHGQAKLFIEETQPDVNNGDVLILWDGAGAGDILQGREGVLSSTLARFTPNLKVESEYLFYALKARESILKNTAQGMGIPHVDGKVLKNLVIKLPSKKRQSEMATMARETLQRLQEVEDKTRQMNALLKEKRSALITAAVTGQIDIPE